MTDREEILERLRAPAAAGETSAYATRDARAVAPVIAKDLAAQFRAKAISLASSVAGPVPPDDAPALVRDYLKENRLPFIAVCWADLAGLPWSSAGLEVSARAARDTDLVGITGAYCAIAESGTLMLLSGPRTPPSASLLPETHIALLPTNRIVARMEDAWKLLRGETADMPRAVNFVSGPSRTADVEQTVTLGAHGPYRVHIVLTS